MGQVDLCEEEPEEGHRELGASWNAGGTQALGGAPGMGLKADLPGPRRNRQLAISKCMSTKYPLTLLVMEVSETVRARRCELFLEWFRRDRNQLADDLTNGKFYSFDPQLRQRWDGGSCPWMVLDRFLKHARSYREEMVKTKVARREKTKLPGW